MKVLIIDDDTDICALLKARMSEQGFLVEVAHTGKGGTMMARLNKYDLLVVDLNLPDMSGEQVIQEVREAKDVPPILMFTVVSDVQSKVRMLNSGADDYLVKPFAYEEFLARAHALLRRPKTALPEMLSVEDLHLDSRAQVVRRGRRSIMLTRKEFNILERLMRDPGIVVSKGEFIEREWNSSTDPFSAAFDTHLANLRRKLGRPELIHTVRGRGYKIG
jgi:DNA-binding response OmpR family regulator